MLLTLACPPTVGIEIQVAQLTIGGLRVSGPPGTLAQPLAQVEA